MRARLAQLPLRARLALISALAVAVAIALASTVAWFSTRAALRQQVDDALTGRSGATPAGVSTTADPRVARRLAARVCSAQVSELQPYLSSVQVVGTDGSSCAPAGADTVEPVPADRAAARGERRPWLRDARSQRGIHVRVLSQPLGGGYAVLTLRPLSEIDSSLRQLALVLLLVSALGVLLATSVGLGVARAGLAPVDELTRAAEHVARTEDLDVPIRVRGDDEVARLARAFNAMTSALASSRLRQQQLVADASHELRTPLTSLRTNIEWLARSEDIDRPLPPAQRRRLLASIAAQTAELTDLIGELTALARDEKRPHGPVQFDEVVLRAAERAQLRAGGRRLELDLEPWTVLGDAVALERAVLNVLDNAVKFSPPDSPIEVRLSGGRLTVTDRGTGIPVEERSLVFRRFWRSPTARELPGSGLGLAIVAETVAEHGGRVHVEEPAGPQLDGAVCGTRVVLELPAVPNAPEGRAASECPV